jgi:alkylhydroperoxidase/carboxymuconolactone decarboxylase family protein YurZ
MFKKFVDTTAAISFTLAGSVVVFITLSGETRKMAMIATAVALGVHYARELTRGD